jgi:hypothetical protein
VSIHPLGSPPQYALLAVGPYVAVFPVRVKANTHLTLTIPYSSPDHFTYNVSVQVQGW